MQFKLLITVKIKSKVYTIKCWLISTLVDSYKQAGSYKVKWDSKRFWEEVYYIKFFVGSNTLIKKTIIIN